MIDIAFLTDTFLKLAAAVPTTLGLFFCSFIVGGVFALIILSMRLSQWRVLRVTAKAYILVFRGSPLMIQLFLIYYGLGQFAVIRESLIWPVIKQPFFCAIFSLALCTAAYTAEILRGARQSIPPGQIEAGLACGMSRWLLLRRIIAPITLRYALPAYSTEAILLVKSTALASLVTVWEVTGVAQKIIQQTYRTLEVFICAAVIYLLINYVLIKAFQLLERYLSKNERPTPTTAVAEPQSVERS